MMESPPASPLEVSQAEFALQFLVVAFDAPSQLDDVDENHERHVLGQGREPVFGRLRGGGVMKTDSRKASQPSRRGEGEASGVSDMRGRTTMKQEAGALDDVEGRFAVARCLLAEGPGGS